jgi:hypothetical protein
MAFDVIAEAQRRGLKRRPGAGRGGWFSPFVGSLPEQIGDVSAGGQSGPTTSAYSVPGGPSPSGTPSSGPFGSGAPPGYGTGPGSFRPPQQTSGSVAGDVGRFVGGAAGDVWEWIKKHPLEAAQLGFGVYNVLRAGERGGKAEGALNRALELLKEPEREDLSGLFADPHNPYAQPGGTAGGTGIASGARTALERGLERGERTRAASRRAVEMVRRRG